MGKRERDACSLRFVALSLEFRRTLKIIERILREVVNRVKLCGQHTVRCSHVEVQSHVVVRRRVTLETRMSLRPPSPPDRDIDSDVYVLVATPTVT